MTTKQVQVWEDSQGVFHRTEEDALAAEERYRKRKEVEDIKRILLRESRRNGLDKVPLTVDTLAETAIVAFDKIVEYYQNKGS